MRGRWRVYSSAGDPGGGGWVDGSWQVSGDCLSVHSQIRFLINLGPWANVLIIGWKGTGLIFDRCRFTASERNTFHNSLHTKPNPRSLLNWWTATFQPQLKLDFCIFSSIQVSTSRHLLSSKPTVRAAHRTSLVSFRFQPKVEALHHHILPQRTGVRNVGFIPRCPGSIDFSHT